MERRRSAVSTHCRTDTALISSKLVGTQKFLRPRPEGMRAVWDSLSNGATPLCGVDTLPDGHRADFQRIGKDAKIFASSSGWPPRAVWDSPSNGATSLLPYWTVCHPAGDAKIFASLQNAHNQWFIYNPPARARHRGAASLHRTVPLVPRAPHRRAAWDPVRCRGTCFLLPSSLFPLPFFPHYGALNFFYSGFVKLF